MCGGPPSQHGPQTADRLRPAVRVACAMFRAAVLAVVLLSACRDAPDGDQPGPDSGMPDVDGAVTPTCDALPADCATAWEQAAADKFDAVLGNPDQLAAFLTAVPKGGDLHNHLSGAVYAETYLDWG